MNTTGKKFGGRKKGTLNKDTSELRGIFKKLIENNIEILQSDLSKLEPKERFKVILDLARFVLPTLKATELTDNIEKLRSEKVTINFSKILHSLQIPHVSKRAET